MKITGLIWLEQIVDKLLYKHQVETYEVEQLFRNKPKYRFVEKGEREGEDIYLALGQTHAGRYLIVLFIYKKSQAALVLSARNMGKKERKYYGRK